MVKVKVIIQVGEAKVVANNHDPVSTNNFQSPTMTSILKGGEHISPLSSTVKLDEVPPLRNIVIPKSEISFAIQALKEVKADELDGLLMERFLPAPIVSSELLPSLIDKSLESGILARK